MKIWLVHSEEVTLREQIVRQVTLGVLSGELSPGERLPSVREVARRFRIHSNTVSAAYHQLRREGWVEARRGSGVYVRPKASDDEELRYGALELDSLLRRVVQTASTLGVSDAEVHRRLEEARNQRQRLLLLEPDPELGRLAQYECVSAGCAHFEVCNLPISTWGTKAKDLLRGFLPAVLPSKAVAAREALGQDSALFVFSISPVAATLASNLPVSRDHLVAIASAWPQFLEVAQTLLVATGFSVDALLVRDARANDWQVGLTEAAAVICDALTAKRLPQGANALVFPLIAEPSFEQLRKMGYAAKQPQ